MLDLDIAAPKVSDLMMVYTGSRQAEATGGVFTPDGTTLFINNQHPDGSGGTNDPALDKPGDRSAAGNVYPYQRATTIAVTGFNTAALVNIPVIEAQPERFVVYPNPTFQTIHFNKITDFHLFDTKGTLVMHREAASNVNLMGLPPGIYFLRAEGQTVRIVLQ